MQGHQALVELIEGGDRKRLEKAAADKAEAERLVAAKEASERAAVGGRRPRAAKERAAAERRRPRRGQRRRRRLPPTSRLRPSSRLQQPFRRRSSPRLPPRRKQAVGRGVRPGEEDGARRPQRGGWHPRGSRWCRRGRRRGEAARRRDRAPPSHGGYLSSGGWRRQHARGDQRLGGGARAGAAATHARTPDGAPAHRCAPCGAAPRRQRTRTTIGPAVAPPPWRACTSAFAPAARPRAATMHMHMHMRTRTAGMCWQRSSWARQVRQWCRLAPPRRHRRALAAGIALPTNVPNPLSAASIGSVGPAAPRAQPPADAATADPRQQGAGGGAGGAVGAGNMQQFRPCRWAPPAASISCMRAGRGGRAPAASPR